MSKRGTCIHYNGIQNDACNAGVNYSAAFGAQDGRLCRAPCIQEYPKHEKVRGEYVKVWHTWPRHGQQEVACDKRVMPTEEEVAAADAEFAGHM
jgi:hypothetical protein